MPNDFSKPYQLRSPFPYLGLLGGISHFYSNFGRTFCNQTVDKPDQTPHCAASDLGLHCLPMLHKKGARLIWVNINNLCIRATKTCDSAHVRTLAWAFVAW